MSKKNQPKALKKEAKQERSKQIVNSILDGATRVLSSIPLNEATTKRIAEIAGVGIGSLYDYFPDKKSIAISLVDKKIKESLEEFYLILSNPSHQSIDEKAQAVTDYLMTEFADRKNFLHQIFQVAPESGRIEVIIRSRGELINKVEEYLTSVAKGYSQEELHAKSFICVHAVLGIVEGYIIQDTVKISPRSLEKALKKIILETLDITVASTL